MITITLPLPDRKLHPNGGRRWSHNYITRLIRDHRFTGKISALVAIANAASSSAKAAPPRWKKAVAGATFYFKTKRSTGQDDDNLIGWLKPYRDGIADAGVVLDDQGMRWIMIAQLVDKDDPRVVIAMEEET